MRIASTREMIQLALGAPYSGDSALAEMLAYLTRIQHTQNTGLVKLVIDIQLAKIRAAVNYQRAPIPQWLFYAYGPDEVANKASQKRLISHILALKLHTLPISTKKSDRLEKLCLCALEDYRLGLFRGQRLPILVYAEIMDVNADNFARDWSKYQEKALDLIKSLDSDGVGHVSVTVREIREAELADH